MESNALDTFTLTTLLVLVVATPLLGIWDFRRLIRWIEEGRRDARLKSYHWILAMEWGMTLGLTAWWFASGRDLATLGLVPAFAGWRWVALALGLAGSLFMVWQMFTALRDPAELAKIRAKMGDLSALAPQTGAEHRAFNLVAVTAGICEEILYRGILLGALAPVLGLWQAVVLSSIVFGMGHAYQGLAGILKTGLVGLVMALLTVFSGSLLAAIVLHAVIDLTSGRMLGAALRAAPPEDEPGVAGKADIGPQPQFFHDAGPESLLEGIGFFNQLQYHFNAFRFFQVNGNGPPSPVQHIHFPHSRIAFSIHPNDVSPHIRQHHGTKRSGSDSRYFNNFYSF